jgi:hypothetical protein
LGADKAAQDADGGTALHVAACYGHVEAIRVLVEELGMDKEATNANGQTSLHVAAGNGQVEAMEVLVQLGADKDAKDVNGWTPLRWAADMGHPRAVESLTQLGADVNASSPSSVLADVLKFSLVGWVDVWCSLSTRGRSIMRAVLAAATSLEPLDVTSGAGCWGGAVQVRRLVSDGCGHMAMKVHTAAGRGWRG